MHFLQRRLISFLEFELVALWQITSLVTDIYDVLMLHTIIQIKYINRI